jgi:hypothetical protein
VSGASGTTESGCETWPIVRDYRRAIPDSQLPSLCTYGRRRTGQTHGVWSCQVDLDGLIGRACSFRRRRDRVEQLLEDIFGEFEVDRSSLVLVLVCG